MRMMWVEIIYNVINVSAKNGRPPIKDVDLNNGHELSDSSVMYVALHAEDVDLNNYVAIYSYFYPVVIHSPYMGTILDAKFYSKTILDTIL